MLGEWGRFLGRRSGGKAAGCLVKLGTCCFGKNINAKPVIRFIYVNILSFLCSFICVKLNKRASVIISSDRYVT